MAMGTRHSSLRKNVSWRWVVPPMVAVFSMAMGCAKPMSVDFDRAKGKSSPALLSRAEHVAYQNVDKHLYVWMVSMEMTDETRFEDIPNRVCYATDTNTGGESRCHIDASRLPAGHHAPPDAVADSEWDQEIPGKGGLTYADQLVNFSRMHGYDRVYIGIGSFSDYYDSHLQYGVLFNDAAYGHLTTKLRAAGIEPWAATWNTDDVNVMTCEEPGASELPICVDYRGGRIEKLVDTIVAFNKRYPDGKWEGLENDQEPLDQNVYATFEDLLSRIKARRDSVAPNLKLSAATVPQWAWESYPGFGNMARMVMHYTDMGSLMSYHHDLNNVKNYATEHMKEGVSMNTPQTILTEWNPLIRWNGSEQVQCDFEKFTPTDGNPVNQWLCTENSRKHLYPYTPADLENFIKIVNDLDGYWREHTHSTGYERIGVHSYWGTFLQFYGMRQVDTNAPVTLAEFEAIGLINGALQSPPLTARTFPGTVRMQAESMPSPRGTTSKQASHTAS